MMKIDEKYVMSFSQYAMFPQVPTVAAVRIALYKKTRDRSFVSSWPRCWIRVSAAEWNTYRFCAANAETFVVNAQRCAEIYLDVQRINGGPYGRWPNRVALDACGQMMLNSSIAMQLYGMCLNAVPDERRELLEPLLEDIGNAVPWDRHKAAMLLVRAL